MAASSSAIRAGSAFVELKTKDAGFSAGLKKAAQQVKEFGAAALEIGASMGAAIAAGMGVAIKSFIDTGTELNRLSRTLGMSVENLSLLKVVASESGVELEDLAHGIEKLQEGLGGTKAGKALQDIGFDISSIDGKGATEQIIAVVDALARMEDQAQAMKAARELFGRRGAGILNIARRTQGGLGGAMTEAGNAGLGISSEDAKRAEEFDEALTRLWNIVKRVAFEIGGTLAKAILDFGQGLKDAEGLIESFGSTAGTTFQGITDSIKTGNWGEAIRIAFVAMKLEFVKGLQELMKLWTDFSDWLAERATMNLPPMLFWPAGKFVKDFIGPPSTIGASLQQERGALERQKNAMVAEAAAKVAGQQKNKFPSVDRGSNKQLGIAELSAGTLSSYGVAQSLGVGNKIQEKIATNTDKTAQNTAQILEAIKNGNLQWF